MIRFLLAILSFTAWSSAGASEVADFRPRVKEALARGEKLIVITPGTYRLAPQGG